ncbi:MAG: hypothetical protein KC473_03235, partial [Candidatus Dadabacteria bacterium]|nr:hypothetical protein [Candidatus Dadabacteria bacterium]
MTEPAKKSPVRKSTLILISILFTLVVLEIGTRIWLAIIPEEESLQYSVYSYLSPDNQRYIRHHYLNYYPNPHFKRGKT